MVKNIPHETNPRLIGSHYAALTPGQLQILASLPDNENAFTKINEATIQEDDPLYDDRTTEIPDPVHGPAYIPDPANILLYVDQTLNGQSSNYYFYAIKSVDTNGLQSILSLSTPPVEIPKTTAPPAPVITSISGGENQIRIKWAKNPGAEISGYMLYRTQDKNKAKDWRRMELIKAHETDTYTVEVTAPLPRKEFEFIDNTVLPRLPYYYGLIAVGLDNNGKQLKSRMSAMKIGQAYDLTPPDPPVWDEVSSGWVYVDENETIYEWTDDLSSASNPQPAVRLVWQTAEATHLTQIARQPGEGGLGTIILNFGNGLAFGPNSQMLIDKEVDSRRTYIYKAKAKSVANLTSAGETSCEIINV